MQGQGLDPALIGWAADVLGGSVTSTTRTPSGGSRETWFVEVARGDGERIDAVLRVEAGGSFTGTDINVTNEAAVYRALEGTGVPAPRVYGVAPGGAALLLERLPGSDDLGRDPEEREATLNHFVDVIAGLHRLDVETLDLPGFQRPRTPEDHARLDLARWASLAERAANVDPIVHYAGAWLLAHPPASVARTCLVQGDTGPGNFVAEGGKVTGLIDMEFAHIGDPMDDIAWIMGRAFGGSELDPGPYLARYSERSGVDIRQGSVDYYQAAVQYRCAITTSLAVARGGGARGWAPYLLVTERYVLATAERLSRLLGVDEPLTELPDVPPTPRTEMFDDLMEGLREGVRGIADPDLKESTRNRQILVHFLRAHDRLGPAIEELDADDARATGLPTGDEELRVAVESAGATGDEAVLRYLLRRTSRHRALWSTILDRPRR